MADIARYFPKLMLWEGGYVNDPLDSGGATNMGVTLATWKAIGHDEDGDGDIDADDIRLLKPADAMYALKLRYWDRWRADDINNQSIAEALVDWVWSSGKFGITIPQRILGVVADGNVGDKTIQAVNSIDSSLLFGRIRHARLEFIDSIIRKTPTNRKFETGWKRRINSIIWQPTVISRQFAVS